MGACCPERLCYFHPPFSFRVERIRSIGYKVTTTCFGWNSVIKLFPFQCFCHSCVMLQPLVGEMCVDPCVFQQRGRKGYGGLKRVSSRTDHLLVWYGIAILSFLWHSQQISIWRTLLSILYFSVQQHQSWWCVCSPVLILPSAVSLWLFLN